MLYDTSTMQPQFRYSNGGKMTGSSVLGHVAKLSTAAVAVLPSKSLIGSNRITSCMTDHLPLIQHARQTAP